MSTEFLRSKHDRQQILNTFYGRPLSLLFFSTSAVTDILATVAPIGVKFCMMVHTASGHKVSALGGGTPRGNPKFPNFGPKF